MANAGLGDQRQRLPTATARSAGTSALNCGSAATIPRRHAQRRCLAIAGQQEVRVNFELAGGGELLVSGFVRPADITRQNEIPYDKIASARISYGGRGQISECPAAALWPTGRRCAASVLSATHEEPDPPGRHAASRIRRRHRRRTSSHADRNGIEDAAAPGTSDAAPVTEPEAEGGQGGAEVEGQEYVRLNNQFVVPVVDEARVEALVVPCP